MAEKGTVYLIGAGPGDPGLITVKGRELLQSCDSVVYDDLIPPELIFSLPAGVEKYYVGKRSGKHSSSQEEINELLVKLASEGKSVARLKGGDPFIFGRGREEAQFLREKGVRFEVVPGVTAGIAAPAFAGIPCTDREKSSFVVFATGHKAAEKEISSAPWEWIASANGGTVVIYMGVAELENIVGKLLAARMSPELPVAVIEQGTLPMQRTVIAPLKEIVAKARSEKIEPPAIVVIGNVVDFHGQLEWFCKGLFSGLKIMVTRPADQASEIYQVLRNHGAEVMAYPTIATENSADAEAWELFHNANTHLVTAANKGWLIFTSENGVRYFMGQLLKMGNDLRTLGVFKIAALGYGTQALLKSFGIIPDFIPTIATSVALANQFSSSNDLRGVTAVRVRGNLGDERIENKLRESGAIVIKMQVYRTYTPTWPDGFKEKLLARPPDIITFTSGSTVDGLFDILGDENAHNLLDHAKAVSIGPSTSRILQAHGGRVWLEAEEHSVPGIITELLGYYRANPAKENR
jgi:uroporphyrinogen III methyltransferase/synthase